MSKFFAVANANGPISVAIDVDSAGQAAEWLASQTANFVDDCRTDAEDALGFCGDGMSSQEFASHLEACGYTVVDNNLCGDHNWALWAKAE